MIELRKKLEEVLGDDLPIEIGTDLRGRPIAMVEDLRFTLTSHPEENQKSLMLLDICHRCHAETGSIIDSLADLGQLFEAFETVISLGCSVCIGLKAAELKP